MQEIAAQELKDRLEAGEPLRVVDIREADEFADWHIHGSANLPVYDALKRNDDQVLAARSGELPSDACLVLVCRGGIVSRRAAALLSGLGFDALTLSGGMHGWGRVWSEAPVDGGETLGLIQVRRNGKGCLSYLFGATGEAAVVDASVDVQAYLQLAERGGLRITHVLETHVHADHLSRARELCSITGATLTLPPNDRVTYPYTPIPDGGTLTVGGITLEAVRTPGHTGESTCYVIGDRFLLTGDTLFVDGVGRPDLEKGDAGAENGARALYRSLREQLLGRFDDVTVLPTHHGGPIGFDRRPIGARLSEIRPRLDLVEGGEEAFVERIVASLKAKPPNCDTIIAVNEGKSDIRGADPYDLEAGPNRCAAG